MDQNTVAEFLIPPSEDPLSDWRDGDAWLAGGTLIFSAPMPHLHRLRDLSQMGWPALTVTDDGLEIAATCTVAELHAFEPPQAWSSGWFLRACVEEYLAGFKMWTRQTVGGNICASLPAGPMITMASALDAQYTLWSTDGSVRVVSALDFVTGDNANVLQRGELLRSIVVPLASLSRPYAIRRFSLTKQGRSTVFLVGTIDAATRKLVVTVTAATIHPVQVRVAASASRDDLHAAIGAAIPESLYFADPNGTPQHRRHLTHVFAQELQVELSEGRQS